MSERFEYIEEIRNNTDTSDWKVARNFRETENAGLEYEQSIGMKEKDVYEGKWVNTGIQDVPVDKIDDSDSPVNSPEDFRKVSYDEVVRGSRTLQNELQPAVQNGADKEYFEKLDKQRGIDYPNGSTRIYEAFYGDNAIKLNKIGDRYYVENGYHRIFVAKELGIARIPALVIEKQV
jgi:hypothetical protein